MSQRRAATRARGPSNFEGEPKEKKTRKTKKESGDDSWPADLRAEAGSTGLKVLGVAGVSNKFIGAHVSAAGGIQNAVYNAVAIGCRAFALFLRNQRRWDAKPMEDEVVQKWKTAIAETDFDVDMIVPHGSYLLNAGSPNEELREKSKKTILDEVQRCEKLGIKLYNFHPGSTTGKSTVEESVGWIAGVIDEVIEATKNVIILIETMAGQGSTIGGTFEEMRQILDAVKPENQNRVGVCLDTCHIFAGGYDIRTKETYEKTMQMFAEVIGFDKLKAVHLNDSKSGLNSHLDRHEHIGQGELKALWPFLMNDSRFDKIPLILETPEGKYPEEMMKLHKLEQFGDAAEIKNDPVKEEPKFVDENVDKVLSSDQNDMAEEDEPETKPELKPKETAKRVTRKK